MSGEQKGKLIWHVDPEKMIGGVLIALIKTPPGGEPEWVYKIDGINELMVPTLLRKIANDVEKRIIKAPLR